MFRRGQLVTFYIGFYAHMTRDATYRVEDVLIIKTKKYLEPRKLVVVKNNLGQTVAMSSLFFKEVKHAST